MQTWNLNLFVKSVENVRLIACECLVSYKLTLLSANLNLGGGGCLICMTYFCASFVSGTFGTAYWVKQNLTCKISCFSKSWMCLTSLKLVQWCLLTISLCSDTSIDLKLLFFKTWYFNILIKKKLFVWMSDSNGKWGRRGCSKEQNEKNPHP